MDLRWFVYLLVELHLLDDALDERPRVLCVVDGIVVREAYLLCLVTEYAREDRVESAHTQLHGLFVA